MVWAAVLLTLAVFVVPAGLLSARGFPGEAALVAASASAFVSADLSAPLAGSDALAELTVVWQEFHLVKAAIAAALVVALVGIASTVGDRAEGVGHGRRRWLLYVAHPVVVFWLLGAVAVLLANLQGAAVPFASVASLLPAASPASELGGVVSQLRMAVERDSSPLVGGLAGELLSEFARYHAVFAALAAVTGGVLVTLAVRGAWRRWRLGAKGLPVSPLWPVQTITYGAAGCLFLVLSLANAATWARPVPAFVASLLGS